MYSALELHKEIFQGLQTVDAFTQDMFLPEEIDFHLNKQQDSFVNELLDGGFAERQIRLDYIQDIIVKNKILPVFTAPTSFYYESGAVNSFLPGNYKHLLTARVKVRETVDCALIVEKMVDFFYFTSHIELRTTSNSSPYYSKVQFIRIEEDQSETVLATVEAPVIEKEDVELIMKTIVSKASLESSSVEYYLGKYPDSTRSSNIVGNRVIRLNSYNNKIKYKLVTFFSNGSIDSDKGGEAIFNRKIEVWDPKELDKLASGKWTSAVLLDNKTLYERKQNIFYFPKPTEPHISIADGILFTYYGNSFLPEEVMIDYIREPQPISLLLNQGCELSESAARIIANRTIEYLKLAIENPAYREVLQYNELREVK